MFCVSKESACCSQRAFLIRLCSTFNSPLVLQIKTLFRKDGSTTAKLHLVADLKNMDDLPASTADPAMGGVPLAAGRAGNAVIMQNGVSVTCGCMVCVYFCCCLAPT